MNLFSVWRLSRSGALIQFAFAGLAKSLPQIKDICGRCASDCVHHRLICNAETPVAGWESQWQCRHVGVPVYHPAFVFGQKHKGFRNKLLYVCMMQRVEYHETWFVGLCQIPLGKPRCPACIASGFLPGIRPHGKDGIGIQDTLIRNILWLSVPFCGEEALVIQQTGRAIGKPTLLRLGQQYEMTDFI